MNPARHRGTVLRVAADGGQQRVSKRAGNRKGKKLGRPRPNALTDDEWSVWVEAFAQRPGQPQVVAKALGASPVTSHKYWHLGDGTRPPIKETVLELRREARALRAMGPSPDDPAQVKHIAVLMDREKRRLALERDRAETMAEEGRVAQAARRNALALGLATASMLQGAMKLSERVRRQLELRADDPSVSVKESIALLRQIATVTRFSNEASKLSVHTERVIMGAPIAPPEGADDGEQLSTERSMIWIEEAAEMVKRARARAALLVDVVEVDQGDGDGS